VPRQLAEQMMHEADLFIDPRGPYSSQDGRKSESEVAAQQYLAGVH
jgi:hypothetical protein